MNTRISADVLKYTKQKAAQLVWRTYPDFMQATDIEMLEKAVKILANSKSTPSNRELKLMCEASIDYLQTK